MVLLHSVEKSSIFCWVLVFEYLRDVNTRLSDLVFLASDLRAWTDYYLDSRREEAA